MMLKFKYILILLTLSSVTLFGQYRSETLQKADVLYQNHKIYEAIDYYILAIEEAPYMQELFYKVASSYKSLGAAVDAKKWYEEVLKFKKQDYPLAKYEYALVLKSLGEYFNAIEQFEQFIKLYRGDDKSVMSKIVEKQIKGCDRALLSEEDNSFEVVNLTGVNSYYTDLSPYIFEDTLYFSGIKTDTPLIYLDDIGIKVQIDLLKIGFDVKEDTAKGPVLKYGPTRLGTDKPHNTSAVYSDDGKQMFFVKCTSNLKFENRCDIYGANKKDNKWEPALKLGPTVNDVLALTSSTHPCITTNKGKKRNTLYFSSNRLGGQGGYDLWTVEIDKDLLCGIAKNLGRRINSIGDEITPSYDEASTTLYYSSNGHIGFGGFDIFKVKKKGSRFGKTNTLENPFNTSFDEFYFQKFGDDKYIFASNRIGAKKYFANYVLDDLFIIRKIEKKKYLIVSVEEENGKQVEGSKVEVISSDKNLSIEPNIPIRVYRGTEYKLSSNLEGFINDSYNITIEEESNDTIHVKLVVKQLVQEQEIQLKNIYFDYTSAVLKDTSKLEVDLLYNILVNNPRLIIELGAHTDSKGADRYNLNLSQRRAQSVVNYLAEKGIPKKRLIAKGYGETKPIAPNNNPDGSDNPKNRQLNRRIVFKIIGLLPLIDPSLDSDSASIDSLGSSTFDNLIPFTGTDTIINGEQTTTYKIPSPGLQKCIVDSTTSALKALSDTIHNTAVDKTDSTNIAEQKTKITAIPSWKKVYVTVPIDASPVKDRVRWIKKAGAQRITSKVAIRIDSITLMYKEKLGLNFKIRVVKASSGKLIAESEEFSVKANKRVSPRLMKLHTVSLDFKLKKGSYFIFPVITNGFVAFLPRYTHENSFDNGNVIVHKAMFTNNYVGKPIKYKFKTKDEKNNDFGNYGPFLKIQIDATSDAVRNESKQNALDDTATEKIDSIVDRKPTEKLSPIIADTIEVKKAITTDTIKTTQIDSVPNVINKTIEGDSPIDIPLEKGDTTANKKTIEQKTLTIIDTVKTKKTEKVILVDTVKTTNIDSKLETDVEAKIKPQDSTSVSSLESTLVSVQDSIQGLTQAETRNTPAQLAVDSFVTQPVVVESIDSVKQNDNSPSSSVMFESLPKDVSVNSDNFRWIEEAVAQKIITDKTINIKSLRIIARKQTGVTLTIRVVDAKTGKIVTETSSFTLPEQKSTPAWMMKYFDVETNIKLNKGSYFIYPVITSGDIAYLPKYTFENSQSGITIKKGMYRNFKLIEGKKQYIFNEAFEKSNAFNNYGPFLKYVIEIVN